MTTTGRWVIGRGLLGAAVARACSDDPLNVVIRWADPERTLIDLGEGLARLLASTTGPLEIYWCAGKAVTSTPPAQLAVELATFEAFLALISDLPAPDRARIAMFLASSVGGAYGGSSEPPFTEATPTMPGSQYGATKLAMESALQHATQRGGWRSFVARITNLYGPGQDLSKGQGLLSVIVSSYLTKRAVSVYVSLDTLRDYIYEDDCARVILAGTERVSTQEPGTTVIKIVGAMAAQSIGAILGENRRLRGRRAPVVLGQGDSAGQASDLRVRSEVWADLDSLVRTTLAEGLDSLYRSQLASLGRGLS